MSDIVVHDDAYRLQAMSSFACGPRNVGLAVLLNSQCRAVRMLHDILTKTRSSPTGATSTRLPRIQVCVCMMGPVKSSVFRRGPNEGALRKRRGDRATQLPKAARKRFGAQLLRRRTERRRPVSMGPSIRHGFGSHRSKKACVFVAQYIFHDLMSTCSMFAFPRGAGSSCGQRATDIDAKTSRSSMIVFCTPVVRAVCGKQFLSP